MPGWNSVQNEVRALGSAHDITRRKYLARLARLTGRNAIVYYSGWLEKAPLVRQGLQGTEVNDGDKNGLMATIHGMNRDRGLDLLLHTPAGDLAATESIVDYLRSMFGTDIRVIVPQLALSAGTMIALASKQIIMGAHSSLGPIDPQTNGVAAHGLVEEFNRARKEIKTDPSTIPIWQPIIAKYPPTLVGECEKAMKWATDMVSSWLRSGMFAAEPDTAEAKATRILKELADHALTLSHARHISVSGAEGLGLNVMRLESDQKLQEAVLSVHHACVLTLGETHAFKIIESDRGVSFISGLVASA